MIIVERKEYKNGRVQFLLDNGVSFVLYKKEASYYGLREGDFLEDTIWQEIKQEVLIKRAKKRVMFLLQKKDYTEKQLRDKLRENRYPYDVAEEALQYVQSFHYVDDCRYASNYVHVNQNSKSVMQIKMDLSQKGVSKEYIDKAIEEELEVSQEEVICSYLRKKQYDSANADEGEKRRVYQFLMRKGFKSSDILRCMNIEEFA